MAKVRRQPQTKDGEWVTKDGSVVTPEIEERWAEELRPSDDYGEALDPSTFGAVQVGRAPADRERVSQRLSIRIPPDLHEAARAKARAERRSLGNLVRAALRRFVDD